MVLLKKRLVIAFVTCRQLTSPDIESNGWNPIVRTFFISKKEEFPKTSELFSAAQSAEKIFSNPSELFFRRLELLSTLSVMELSPLCRIIWQEGWLSDLKNSWFRYMFWEVFMWFLSQLVQVARSYRIKDVPFGVRGWWPYRKYFKTRWRLSKDVVCSSCIVGKIERSDPLH